MSDASVPGISDRLRTARKAAGLSTHALDRASGCVRGHTAQIESGKRSPTAHTASKIARALGVTLDWLVNGDGRAPSERSLRAVGERLREAG